MNNSDIKQLALEVGFDACGITSPQFSSEEKKRFAEWIQEGKHAGMRYLEDFELRAQGFWKQFPNAKSVIVLSLNYFSHDDNHYEGAERLKQTRTEIASSRQGRIARYARGQDYHFVIREKLEALKSKISVASSRKIHFEEAVDTKPVLERSLAERAGLGFIGRQTQLLSPEFGPWLLLAELITDLELEPDEPFIGSCGSCRRCIDRCPTNAIEPGGGIDARKCIAYLTIESKAAIPLELREKIGTRVFGCDECLEVCPYTSKQKEARCEDLKSSAGAGSFLDLESLFDLKSEREYRSQFQGSAILRAKRAQLLRNACVVLGNSKQKSALRVLRQAREDFSPLVREHADWALRQFNQFY